MEKSLTPVTRKEMYLEAIATGEAGAELPTPVTREEYFLYAAYLALSNGSAGGSAGGGPATTNYNALTNKPKINGVELAGNLTWGDLGLIDGSEVKF